MPPKQRTQPMNDAPGKRDNQPAVVIEYEKKTKRGKTKTTAPRPTSPIPWVYSDIFPNDHDRTVCAFCLFQHDERPRPPCPYEEDPPSYQTSDAIVPGDNLTDEALSNVRTVNPTSLTRPRPRSPNPPLPVLGATTDNAIVVAGDDEAIPPPSAPAVPTTDGPANGKMPSPSNTASSDGSQPSRKRPRSDSNPARNAATLASSSPAKRARLEDADEEIPTTEGPGEEGTAQIDPLSERYQTGEYLLLDVPSEAMSPGRKLGFHQLLKAAAKIEPWLKTFKNLDSVFPLEGQRTPRKWIAKLKSSDQAAQAVQMAKDTPLILKGHRVGVRACQSNELSTQVYVSVSRTGDVKPVDLSWTLRRIGKAKTGSGRLWLGRQCYKGVFGGIFVAVFDQPLGVKYIDANVKPVTGDSPPFRFRLHAAKLLESECRVCGAENFDHVVTECPLLKHVRGESDDERPPPEIPPLVFKRDVSVELG
ncbi:hypothetical protein FQN50_003815 [Emmonsiellopsis sp. PD_5]|nr:hypothetical protein FQN50_003815 [Emmonsiellopsis sp. PD_5]